MWFTCFRFMMGTVPGLKTVTTATAMSEEEQKEKYKLRQSREVSFILTETAEVAILATSGLMPYVIVDQDNSLSKIMTRNKNQAHL